MSPGAVPGRRGISQLLVHGLSISLDGYVAGPDQDEENPLGRAGPLLHEWVFSPDATVRLGGGASTVQQYLRAGLLEELGLALVPVVLGDGERLFDNLGDALDGWRRGEFAPSGSVAHARLRRRRSPVFDTMDP
jgi:hypothetical protein